MAEITHELKIHAPKAVILEALTNKAALERWHRAKVTGDAREWTISYPEGPTFRWKVVSATPEAVTWRCEEGPGRAKGKEAAFVLSEAGKGRSSVRIVHQGWSGSEETF